MQTMDENPKGTHYTKKAIKRQFCTILLGFILTEFGIRISNGSISEQDLELFSLIDGNNTFYFLNKFLDNQNLLDHQKLQDFVYENISEFSFYTPDVVWKFA